MKNITLIAETLSFVLSVRKYEKYNFIGIVYMLEKCVQLFDTEGRLHFLTGIFRSRFHGENPCVWLRDGRNGGSGFDVRFARWDLPMRYFANGSPFVALAARTSTRTICHITPGFVYPMRECFLYFLAISHLLAVFSLRFYRWRREILTSDSS